MEISAYLEGIEVQRESERKGGEKKTGISG
jgi:hypothetical protein